MLEESKKKAEKEAKKGKDKSKGIAKVDVKE